MTDPAPTNDTIIRLKTAKNCTIYCPHLHITYLK